MNSKRKTGVLCAALTFATAVLLPSPAGVAGDGPTIYEPEMESELLSTSAAHKGHIEGKAEKVVFIRCRAFMKPESSESISGRMRELPDLVSPVMAMEAPAAGKRVRQVAPEYEGTEVYHSLYLPVDWKPGGKYPVIVEYTGNKFPPGKGSGEVKDANLGYGMSGGRGFIWVSMPYVEKGRKKNTVTWWGDKQATVDYCKVNLPRICKQFGGDRDNVFICGFSRGAIGASYIGLADDQIAALWKGMFTHDHFDGHRKWGYPGSDRESALKRLGRLEGRPVLICGQNASQVRDHFLKDHMNLARFTFLDVPTRKIFNIPEGRVLHSHTDLWMHRDSIYRQHARDWLQKVLTGSFTGSAAPPKYRDGRPEATLRMEAKDHGIVLRYGDGPDRCDMLGARDVWVFEDSGTYYMHYDAAGPTGWLCSLAVSKDLLGWEKKGPVLEFGKPGEDDSKSASYGVTYFDGNEWHMFYLGTPNVSAPPDLIPSFPYLTMKAKGNSAAGPWIKQKDVVPFRPKPGTYYSITASPGQVIRTRDEYLQFFSATTRKSGNPCVQRTLGIARTKNLDGSWTIDPRPMVPIEEQIENASLYYEKSNKTWFLFTNHIGIDRGEYTDAIWVYWSRDTNAWDPANKAVVLDGRNCTWSKKCIGLPSVVQAGKRLALFYDAPGGTSTSHMGRHIGLAWLDLPLSAEGCGARGKKEI